MAVKMSTCGLIVIRGNPYEYQPGLYEETTTDGDPAIAVEFSQQRVAREGLEVGHPEATFWAAAVHPDIVDRRPNLDADMAVDPDREMELHPIMSIFTVCGWYLDNGQTYSDWWSAHGPKMAYLHAWDLAQQDGRTLLLANVHDGQLPRYLPFTFADPSCTSEAMMRDLMSEYVVLS